MPRVEVTTQIDAPPARVWELIGDPTRMGEWSPECRRSAWLDGATGAEIGARFSGRNHIGWRRWTTRCTIVSYEPGHEIGWDVRFAGVPVAHWSYRIAADEGGASCRLAEVFEDRRGRAYTALGPVTRGVRDVERHNRATMEQTLARIKAAAQRAARHP